MSEHVGGAAPAPPQFSPDGHWWWTGTEWIAAAAPPAPPPAPVAVAETEAPAPQHDWSGPGAQSVRATEIRLGVQPVNPAAASNLVADERVVHTSEMHWAAAYFPAALAAVLPVLFLLMAVSTRTAGLAGFAFVLLLFLVAPLIVVGFFQLTTSQFSVTNRRVGIKVGILNRRSLETLLHKIEGVSVAQGPIGSLLGYGKITVNGVGGTREAFPGIRDPQAFRLAVQNQLAQTG